MKPFLWLAHRGASGTEPENTLRAIRRGFELGADGVEVDIQLTREGTPVILHDATLERTTGYAAAVADTSLARLATLDAGCGEPVPTLAQLLDIVPCDRWLNLELKAPGSACALLEAIASHRATHPGWHSRHLLISSFSVAELEAIAAANRTAIEPLQIGLLLDKVPPDLPALLDHLGAGWVHLSVALAEAPLIAALHATGRRILVYTVNDTATLARVREAGANGIFTDFPEHRNR